MAVPKAAEELRIREQLVDSEKKFRSLFETSRDAILLLDPEKGLLDCNQAAMDMFAIPSKKLLSKLTPEILSPKFQPNGDLSSNLSKKYLQRTLNEGFYLFEWQHKSLNRREFPATVSTTPLELDGKIIFQATIRDISTQKAAEEALLREKEFTETAL
ncbi:MAG: PAS domain S-box protein, partial [Spirochaetales bacterium]|nr:PAS domain S-box protein [Spirochaetales bacterium]